MEVNALKEEKARLEQSLTLPNDIEMIPQLNGFIKGFCEALKINSAVIMNLNLAIEEAVVNVMQYAYPKGQRGDIDITVKGCSSEFIVTITDSGSPFDPTQKEEVDISLSAEERPVGGLGIHLIREIMDSLSYEYKDKKNILTLRKKIN